MHVIVFLTFGVSLKDWKEAGLLDREILLYDKISTEKSINFTFVTFGDVDDENYIKNHKVIPYYRYNKYYKNKYLTFLQSFFFTFKIKKLTSIPDLIKTNQLFGSWMAILFKLIINKPLIVRTGYDLYRFSIKEKKNLLKRVFYFVLTQIAILLSNKYVVSSLSDKNFLESNFLSTKNKIIVIPNWVFTTSEKNITKVENRYDNKVLAVGRLEKQKNFSQLIELMSGNSFEIDIIGDGSLRNKLELQAVDQNVKVNFLGKLPYKDLLKVYQNYRLYISTSSFEGNSKSTLEAMASGCVVIISDIENNSEIVKNKSTGLLHNFYNLAELVEEIANNIELLESISSNAIIEVQKTNSLNVISIKEIELYNSFYI